MRRSPSRSWQSWCVTVGNATRVGARDMIDENRGGRGRDVGREEWEGRRRRDVEEEVGGKGKVDCVVFRTACVAVRLSFSKSSSTKIKLRRIVFLTLCKRDRSRTIRRFARRTDPPIPDAISVTARGAQRRPEARGEHTRRQLDSQGPARPRPNDKPRRAKTNEASSAQASRAWVPFLLIVRYFARHHKTQCCDP